jgi:hypothetical protein
MGLAARTNEPFIDGILEVANTIRNAREPQWSWDEFDHALLFLSYLKQYDLSALMRDPERTLAAAALVAGVAGTGTGGGGDVGLANDKLTAFFEKLPPNESLMAALSQRMDTQQERKRTKQRARLGGGDAAAKTIDTSKQRPGSVLNFQLDARKK